MDPASPIVIMGAPRSGTTYLTELLNRDPRIHITNELKVFVWAHRTMHVMSEDFHTLFQRRGEFVDHLRTAYPELIRSFYRKENRPLFWGDKNPHYASDEHRSALPTIIDLFPTAKFVHIIRDGRDVVASVLKKGWESFDTAHHWWLSYTTNASTFGATLPPDQFYEVRYEDFVQDDVAHAEQMFDFLEIEMSEEVRDFCGGQQRRRTAFSGPTRDLSRGAVGSDWSRMLTPPQCVESLTRLGGLLVHYGYETEGSLQQAIDGLARTGRDELEETRTAVQGVLSPGQTVLVVTQGDERLLTLVPSAKGWHFPASMDPGRDNTYLEDELSNEDLIQALKVFRERGACFLFAPSSAIGYLERHDGFSTFLTANFDSLMDGPEGSVYDLRTPARGG
jgi:hypothetical protein